MERDREVGSGERNKRFITSERISNIDIRKFLKGEAMGDRIR